MDYLQTCSVDSMVSVDVAPLVQVPTVGLPLTSNTCEHDTPDPTVVLTCVRVALS